LALIIIGGGAILYARDLSSNIWSASGCFIGVVLIIAGAIGTAFPLQFPGFYTKEFWEDNEEIK
jgi:hypothetical protein